MPSCTDNGGKREWRETEWRVSVTLVRWRWIGCVRRQHQLLPAPAPVCPVVCNLSSAKGGGPVSDLIREDLSNQAAVWVTFCSRLWSESHHHLWIPPIVWTITQKLKFGQGNLNMLSYLVISFAWLYLLSFSWLFAFYKPSQKNLFLFSSVSLHIGHGDNSP